MDTASTREGGWPSVRMRHAFTLRDLVATVVIVVILGVWLIPATAGVRHTSKRSRCLANLARIGFANTIYAAHDSNDMALPVHPRQSCQCPGVPCGEPCMSPPPPTAPYDWGGKSGIGEPAQQGEPWTARLGTANGFGPARRPLNRILYGDTLPDYTDDPGEDYANWMSDTALDLPVHQCPSDSGYTGIHSLHFLWEQRTSYDHFGTSYGANLFMIANSGGGWMRSNSPYLHRMSQMRSPATTLAYQENNGRFAWAAAPEQPECRSDLGLEGIPGTVRGWHGKDWTFNAAFLDGHADAIYMRGYENPQVMPNQPGNGRFQCIVIRGENWQKDTLPVEFVETRLWHGGEGRPSYEGGLH